MAKRCKVVADEIAHRLDTTSIPGSPDRITAEELRTWAIEYLGKYDQVLVRFPEDEVLEMTARFSIPRGSFRLARPTAEQWLGRGW